MAISLFGKRTVKARPGMTMNQAVVDTTGMSKTDPEMAKMLTQMRGAVGAGTPAPVTDPFHAMLNSITALFKGKKK